MSIEKTFVGVDNGTTGAVAILRPDNTLVVKTPVRQVGKDTVLDARALANLFSTIPNPHIVFEIGQKQPIFGTIGNYANGRSHGVLETVIELLGCPYRPVNPKDWQSDCFKGMRKAGEDTKAASEEFCRRTFPQVNLVAPGCRVVHTGFTDALCMAWWAKNRAF